MKMEYSIRELSDMAGVSARTLRYYDQIGLLKPLSTTEAGYRYYGCNEVALLQQILFYRERGFDLKCIRSILYEDGFDIMSALEDHLLGLYEEKRHVDALIRTVKQTISSMKGECSMNDKEKFEVFKADMVKENEEKYGAEARQKYGDESVDASNRKVLNMTEKEYERFEELGGKIRRLLEEGVRSGIKPDGEEAGSIAALHKEWLCMTWKQYTPEAHRGITRMYVEDERFRAYYDKEEQGCAALLKEAVDRWAD